MEEENERTDSDKYEVGKVVTRSKRKELDEDEIAAKLSLLSSASKGAAEQSSDGTLSDDSNSFTSEEASLPSSPVIYAQAKEDDVAVDRTTTKRARSLGSGSGRGAKSTTKRSRSNARSVSPLKSKRTDRGANEYNMAAHNNETTIIGIDEMLEDYDEEKDVSTQKPKQKRKKKQNRSQSGENSGPLLAKYDISYRQSFLSLFAMIQAGEFVHSTGSSSTTVRTSNHHSSSRHSDSRYKCQYLVAGGGGGDESNSDHATPTQVIVELPIGRLIKSRRSANPRKELEFISTFFHFPKSIISSLVLNAPSDRLRPISFQAFLNVEIEKQRASIEVEKRRWLNEKKAELEKNGLSTKVPVYNAEIEITAYYVYSDHPNSFELPNQPWSKCKKGMPSNLTLDEIANYTDTENDSDYLFPMYAKKMEMNVSDFVIALSKKELGVTECRFRNHFSIVIAANTSRGLRDIGSEENHFSNNSSNEIHVFNSLSQNSKIANANEPAHPIDSIIDAIIYGENDNNNNNNSTNNNNNSTSVVKKEVKKIIMSNNVWIDVQRGYERASLMRRLKKLVREGSVNSDYFPNGELFGEFQELELKKRGDH